MKILIRDFNFARKTLIKMLAIFLLVITYSCGKSPLPVIEEIKKVSDIKEIKHGDDVVITVQFASKPGSASSAFTNLKYEKHSVINFEWDDAVRDVLAAQQIFNSKTFTDGAGNNKKYALALNTNGYFHYANAEVGATPEIAVTYAEGKAIINAGGDIANHSMYHDPYGTPGRNYPNHYISPLDMVKRLETLYFEKTGYRMNVMAVPTNYAGYMQAAHDEGYVAGTTTSAPDGFTLYPSGWVNTGNVALLPEDIKFTAFGRQFTDEWGKMVGTYKGYIDELLSGTSATVNKYVRFGSHNLTHVAGFTEIINYLQTQSNDRIWVASLREFAEYRVAKARTIKSEQLVGNTLTITLNQSAISSRVRWRDLTLKITSDANISSVTVAGADSYSANLGTKLINIFKQDLRFGEK
jgi:hypothetical protein